jgi:hypothetical protein
MLPFGSLAVLSGMIVKERSDCFKITALQYIELLAYDPFGALHTHIIKAPFFALRF